MHALCPFRSKELYLNGVLHLAVSRHAHVGSHEGHRPLSTIRRELDRLSGITAGRRTTGRLRASVTHAVSCKTGLTNARTKGINRIIKTSTVFAGAATPTSPCSTPDSNTRRIRRVYYGEDEHWACGDHAVSSWLPTGTAGVGRASMPQGL